MRKIEHEAKYDHVPLKSLPDRISKPSPDRKKKVHKAMQKELAAAMNKVFEKYGVNVAEFSTYLRVSMGTGMYCRGSEGIEIHGEVLFNDKQADQIRKWRENK